MSATGNVGLLWGTLFLGLFYFSASTLLLKRWVHAAWTAGDTTTGRRECWRSTVPMFVFFLNPFF